jgi:regulator of protease activity HflC (stomatin/prohibitin superfamily)
MFKPKIDVDTKVLYTFNHSLEGDKLYIEICSVKDKDTVIPVAKVEIASGLKTVDEVDKQLKNFRWTFSEMMDAIRKAPEPVKAELDAAAEINAKAEAQAKEVAAQAAAEAQKAHDEEVRNQLLAELKAAGQLVE